jgi:hypothetical protein
LLHPRQPTTPWWFAQQKGTNVQPELTDPILDYLLDAAGLTLTEAQKQDLKTIHAPLTAMKARVRQPRGRMAELAHTFAFTAEDIL